MSKQWKGSDSFGNGKGIWLGRVTARGETEINRRVSEQHEDKHTRKYEVVPGIGDEIDSARLTMRSYAAILFFPFSGMISAPCSER